MNKKCSKCNKTAITFIRYNGTYLCKDHFNLFFEKRVKKDIKKQGKTENDNKIGVAISGGKDSLVALKLINDIFKKRRQIEIVAITVDEGIKGYRDNSIKFAFNYCKKLGIEHHIVKFEKMIGKSMDDISVLDNDIGECSFCGVFRRLCLNNISKELHVTKLATGHNLDDMAQSILMNFINGDIQKLARLGPHLKIQPGLIPRMLPLRVIPEKENALYALTNGIEYHDSECPYSINAYRRYFRDIIDGLEFKNPGTRHSILNSYDNIKSILLDKYPPGNLGKCEICCEPTSQKLCKACVLKNKIL